jgi:tubulin beta
LEVLCDENGIGGSGEYCGDNDAHLDSINVFYRDALSGKFVPRAVLFVLEPGAIDDAALSRRSANSSVRRIS